MLFNAAGGGMHQPSPAQFLKEISHSVSFRRQFAGCRPPVLMAPMDGRGFAVRKIRKKPESWQPLLQLFSSSEVRMQERLAPPEGNRPGRIEDLSHGVQRGSSGDFSSTGSQSSILFPSGSMIQPNLPYSNSCRSPTTCTPSLRSKSMRAFRFSTR